MRKVKIRKEKRPKRTVKTGVVKFFILLVILSSVLMLQYYRVTNINIAIRNLEEDVKNQQMINDSIEGELLAKRDLDKIEKIATKEYGMVKATGKKATYISYDYENKDETLATNKPENAGLFSWFNNFVQ